MLVDVSYPFCLDIWVKLRIKVFFFNGTICCLAYNSSDTFTGNPLTPGSVKDLPSLNSLILAQRKGGENYFQFTRVLVEKHQITKLTTIFHCL